MSPLQQIPSLRGLVSYIAEANHRLQWVYVLHHLYRCCSQVMGFPARNGALYGSVLAPHPYSLVCNGWALFLVTSFSTIQTEVLREQTRSIYLYERSRNNTMLQFTKCL